MVMDFDRHLVHMVGDSAGHLWLGTWWTFSSSGFLSMLLLESVAYFWGAAISDLETLLFFDPFFHLL